MSDYVSIYYEGVVSVLDDNGISRFPCGLFEQCMITLFRNNDNIEFDFTVMRLGESNYKDGLKLQTVVYEGNEGKEIQPKVLVLEDQDMVDGYKLSFFKDDKKVAEVYGKDARYGEKIKL